MLDYQALKEVRSEFEQTHKNLRFMVSEWDKRKFSDILSDTLADAIAVKFDDEWDRWQHQYFKYWKGQL